MGAIAALFIASCGGTAATPTAAPRATTTPGAATSTAGTVVPTATAAPVQAGTTVPTAPTTEGSSGAGDVCSLLTPADLATATGKTYLAGILDAAGQCNWNTDASGANSGDLIIVAVQAEPLDFVKSSFGSGGVDATVAGHPAFWNPTLGLQSMWVDVGGGNLLVLSFPRSTDLTAADQQAAQALAEVAVGNM
jgi:hypothetical protein